VQYLISIFIVGPFIAAGNGRFVVKCSLSRLEPTMPTETRREKIERLLAKTPDDPFLLYGLAMAVIAEGDEAGGLAKLRSMAESHPDYHPAHFQIGQLLTKSGDSDEAKDWLLRGSAIAAKAGDMKAAREMADFAEQV
jgi:predicted Zn-dependent protease